MCTQSKIKLAQLKLLNALFSWGMAHLEENLVFFKTLLFLSNTLFPHPNQAKGPKIRVQGSLKSWYPYAQTGHFIKISQYSSQTKCHASIQRGLNGTIKCFMIKIRNYSTKFDLQVTLTLELLHDPE